MTWMAILEQNSAATSKENAHRTLDKVTFVVQRPLDGGLMPSSNFSIVSKDTMSILSPPFRFGLLMLGWHGVFATCSR